jgi:HK97 family phage prohead protease
MMSKKEARCFEFELRAERSEEHGTFITGTPIVFNQETDLGYYRESISPEALENTDLKDVRFLVGHNTSMIPLARSRNNNANSTMQMTVTERGMEIRVDLDTENNADARTLYSAVNRGDISGMSFMFTVDKDSWEDLESDSPKRTITSIGKVFEVSAVAFPAYEGTDLQAADQSGALESATDTLESARQQMQEDRAREADQERRTAVLDWLENYKKEEKADV